MIDPAFDKLTARERECLRLVLTLQESKRIAPELGLTAGTVDQYLKSAARKLGVSGRREAADLLRAHEQGLLQNSEFQPSPIAEPAEPAGKGDAANEAAIGQAMELREDRATFTLGPKQGTWGTTLLGGGITGGNPNALGPARRLLMIARWTVLSLLAFGIAASGTRSLGEIGRNLLDRVFHIHWF